MAAKFSILKKDFLLLVMLLGTETRAQDDNCYLQDFEDGTLGMFSEGTCDAATSPFVVERYSAATDLDKPTDTSTFYMTTNDEKTSCVTSTPIEVKNRAQVDVSYLSKNKNSDRSLIVFISAKDFDNPTTVVGSTTIILTNDNKWDVRNFIITKPGKVLISVQCALLKDKDAFFAIDYIKIKDPEAEDCLDPTTTTLTTVEGETTTEMETEPTTTEGGETTTEGGETTTEGGETTTEGGETTTEGGETTTEGGETTTEEGETTTDGGETTTEEGETTTDGGETTTDGGETTTDGGGATTDGSETTTDGGETTTDGGDTTTDGGGATTLTEPTTTLFPVVIPDSDEELWKIIAISALSVAGVLLIYAIGITAYNCSGVGPSADAATAIAASTPDQYDNLPRLAIQKKVISYDGDTVIEITRKPNHL